MHARCPELRQGRARPGRARWPRRLRGPVPERPGGRRQVVGRSVIDVDPRERLAIAEAALGHAERAGATEAEVLVTADDSALTRFANSEIHQNVAETTTCGEPPVRGRATDRRGHDRPHRRRGPAGRGDAGPARSPGSSRSSRTGRGLPEPGADRATCRLPGSTPRPRRPRSRGPRASGPSSPPPTRPARVAYGSFTTGAETIVVANSKGIRAAQRPDDGPAPDGVDVARRRVRLCRARRDRRAPHRSGRARARSRREGQGHRSGDRPPGRRLPGRPRDLCRRRHPRHARLPRVLRAGRPGGPLLRRARAADRVRPGDDRR